MRSERSAPPGDAVRTGRRKRAATDVAAPPSGKRPSALRDVTRPIARDSRMSERRPVRVGYGLAAGAIGIALVAALVVLPVRRWWNQRADLADRKSELRILEEANARLGNEVTALNTPAGIEAEARDQFNYAYPGEERTRSVGDPQAPIALPPGYTYSLVTAILQSRTNLAAAPANPAGGTPVADPAAAGTSVTDPAAATTAPPATEPPDPTIAPPPGNNFNP